MIKVTLLILLLLFNTIQSHRRRIMRNFDLEQIKIITNKVVMDDFVEILDPILIPRPVNSSNHTFVREYLVQKLQNFGLDTQQHEYQYEDSAIGPFKVVNVVASYKFNASRQLTFAAHYDSLNLDGFIGMSDSAVPCGIILYLSKIIQSYIKKDYDNNRSFQVLFFDAEEAFQQWSSTDSTYGSRALVKQWLQSPPLSQPQSIFELKNRLQQVDLLVLLDLIGTKDFQTIREYYPDTSELFQRLSQIENYLFDNNLLSQQRRLSNKPYFIPNVNGQSFDGSIQDDQIPFVQNNIPVLHLIPSPFPSVWHKISDDKSAMSRETISDFTKILLVFICDYLDLWSYLQN